MVGAAIKSCDFVNYSFPAAPGTVATNEEEFTALKLKNFESYIGWFFETPETYHAIDMTGNDVTREYYDKNIAYFEKKDYLTLMRNTEGYIYSFDKFGGTAVNQLTNQGIPLSPKTLLGTISKSISKGFDCRFRWAPGTNYNSAIVRLRGNYNVDNLNGIITSATQPTVTLETYPQPGLHDMYVSVITRSARISNSQTTVTFGTVFDLYADFGALSGGQIYLGRYVMGITGNTGGLQSYNPSNGVVFPQ